MANPQTPRGSWVDAGLRALAGGGPDEVRVERLARDLGVTKGGFYWYFDGRGALLDEMLDTWERVVVDEVIERLEAESGDPRTKLARLFTLAASTRDLVRTELAIRNWARHDRGVAQRVKRIDNRRMDYMRALFGAFVPDPEEVEARCVLVMALFVGSHFIAADHGGRTRAEVMESTRQWLIDVPPSTMPSSG